MFGFNNSNNTLKQVEVKVTLPSNKKYNGNHRDESVSVVPSYAVFSIKDSQGNKIKTGKGTVTLNTRDDLKMGLDSGASASYSIYPLGDENYTYVLDNQNFITGNFSIEPSEITLSSSGATSFVYNGNTQTVGHTLSGVYAADTGYQVSTTSGTNAGNYTAALSETSGNYTLGTPSSFSWAIAPSVISIASSGPINFVYNGSNQTVGHTLTGVYAEDTGYQVSTTSGTNAGNYTATLSETSGNYTLGSPSSFSWAITKAVLTLTTGNSSMIYGSSVPTQSFGYALSGLLGGDTASVITGSASHSTSTVATSSSDIGSYPIVTNISGLSATNYTFSTVNGTLTINPATLTGSSVNEIRTFNDAFQTVTVINVTKGTYQGSTTIYKRDAGLYSTTITGTNNYIGSSLTGTLTINPAPVSSSVASGLTVYVGYDGSEHIQTVISNLSGLSYTGNPTVKGTNARTYETSLTFSGNYTGTLMGRLIITQATGFISLYLIPDVHPDNTNTVVYNEHVNMANTTSGVSYVFTESAPYGEGAQYAIVQPGYGVQRRINGTPGFKIDITATITDPNYTASSATTTITFVGYTPSSSGGGGTTYGSTTYY